EGTEYGSILTRFSHACEHGNVFHAELAVREMDWVGLPHALRLVCLYAEVESPKFEPAAVRFLGRFALEKNERTLSQLLLAAAALAELRGRKHEAAVK